MCVAHCVVCCGVVEVMVRLNQFRIDEREISGSDVFHGCNSKKPFKCFFELHFQYMLLDLEDYPLYLIALTLQSKCEAVRD